MAYTNADTILAEHNLDTFRGVRLAGMDLSWTDFSQYIMKEVCLENCILIGCTFRGANLVRSSFRNSTILEADFTDANLTGADFTNVQADESTTGFWPVCPMVGEFIAYKKVIGSWSKSRQTRDVIAKLLIPADAKRSSGTNRKCRCSAAKVLALYYPNGRKTSILNAYSCFDSDFDYTVGKTVTADSFDPDRWNECSHGIHFFMTFEEAKIYS